MSDAPGRSLQQRMDALDRANAIRSHRAELKRQLKRGDVTVRQVLEEPTPELFTMKVHDVLRAAPRVGKTKANKALTRARVSPSKTVAGMTDRQRGDLMGVLADYPSLRPQLVV